MRAAGAAGSRQADTDSSNHAPSTAVPPPSSRHHAQPPAAPAGLQRHARSCRTLTYIMLSTLTARSSLNCGASCSRTAFRKPPIVSPLRTDTWQHAAHTRASERAATQAATPSPAHACPPPWAAPTLRRCPLPSQ
jgi:hypothetical protein